MWEFKGKFSRQIPKATKVYEEMTELQTKYTLVQEDMKEMKNKIDILFRNYKIDNILKDSSDE